MGISSTGTDPETDPNLPGGSCRWMASPAKGRRENIGNGHSHRRPQDFVSQHFVGRLVDNLSGQMTLGETVLIEGRGFAQLEQDSLDDLVAVVLVLLPIGKQRLLAIAVVGPGLPVAEIGVAESVLDDRERGLLGEDFALANGTRQGECTSPGPS